MKFARWVFLIAGVYGVLALAPGFFTEARLTPFSHPEFYYGFLGLALVFQFVFFIIASDPLRFRLLMPIAVLEKLSFFAPCVSLYAAGRIEVSPFFIGGLIDGAWMVLFAAAWLRLRGH
ncbi:MAG: hypothetical protein KF700_05235 [Hyphomonadaceae bacterium]|nr:hypothetical protein [Hyphomonadaceae bacterium]